MTSPDQARVRMQRVWVAAAGLCAILAAPARAADPALPIVLTQVPPSAVGAELREGGRVVVVDADGTVRTLSQGLASAADPSLSFEATSVVFAGQEEAGEPWAVYEVKVDGTGLRRILGCEDDLRQPLYLPTVYTLAPDPTKGTDPWRQVAFVRRSRALLAESGRTPASAVWSCQLDGSGAHALTFNLGGDLDPTLLPDGRLLYAAWQRSSLARGREGRLSLLAVNLDGLDPALFAGDEGRRFKRMPAVTGDGLVVFVEGDQLPGTGAGALGSVNLRRNLHSYRPLTPVDGGLFHSPTALANGSLLVSRRAGDGSGTFAVVRLDPASGAWTPLFDDPERDDLQARPLAPRPLPDSRSSVVKEEVPTGTIFALDVYLNDLGPLPRGSLRRLRVLEGMAPTPAEVEPVTAPAGASLRGLPPLAHKRLLGEVPIQEDGSFQVQVPANTPLMLQLLDGDGLALSSSAWIWVRSKANQGCVGCHEDGELAPPNRFAAALGLPAPALDLPPDQRRTIDFRRDVAPILEARCVSCHAERAQVRLDGGLAELGQSGVFSRAYETLLEGMEVLADGSLGGRHVHPGRARTSPLVWHLLGRDTSRPWDHVGAPRQVPLSPPGLTPEERQVLVEWIDLGALWDGIPGSDEASGGGP